MKNFAALSVLFLMLAGCSTMDQAKILTNLTKEHFRDTATLQDDSLETVATITTINGFQEESCGVLHCFVWNDDFLRAIIDKKTGKVTYQLYQILRYRDSGWRYYNRINYKAYGEVQSVPATIISRDVKCDNHSEGCKYEEHVAIILDEEILRIVAGAYVPSKPAIMSYKVTSQTGVEFGNAISAAETAGLLERVDAYLAKR